MIDPTPSPVTIRIGAPPFAVEAGGGPDVVGVVTPGAAVAPAAGPSFARAFDDLIATAVVVGKPATTPAGLPDETRIARQVLAAPGTGLPDVAGLTPPPTVAPADPGSLTAQPGSTTRRVTGPAKSAAPVVGDRDELPEPRLEPALAWLLPPPPPAALPVAVIAAATARPRIGAAALPDGQVQPATGDVPVTPVEASLGRIPVSGSDDGIGKPPIQRRWMPEAVAKMSPLAGLPADPLAAPSAEVRTMVSPVARPTTVSDPTGRPRMAATTPDSPALAAVPSVPVATAPARPAVDTGAPPDRLATPVPLVPRPIAPAPNAIMTGTDQPPLSLATPPPANSVVVSVTAPDGREPRADRSPVAATATAAAPMPVALPITAAQTPAGSAPSAGVAAAVVAMPAARRSDDLLEQGPLALAATMTPQPIAVAATGGAQQAGIDLTRDPGLNRMIDRIETLRDAADARDTRIRLIPDALGPVDIAVRREGEAVHVHFTASEAVTRQLIAEAQPRLAELAEARGVRIDRATVDGGAAGQHGQTAHQPGQQPGQQGRPNRAAQDATAATVTDHNSNQRIA